MRLGLLDFALLDADQPPQNLTLEVSKEILKAGSCANPVFVFANYFLDSLAHDVFKFQANNILKGKVDLFTPQTNYAAGKIKKNDELKVNIHYHEASRKPYENSKVQNSLVQFYSNHLANGTALIPTTGFKVLDYIKSLSKKERVILFSSDKGYTSYESFKGSLDPHLAFHGSSSLMVNYHAFEYYFT